jgi:hypothetical protein
MKKIVFLLLLVFSLGLFAADITLGVGSVKGAVGIGLRDYDNNALAFSGLNYVSLLAAKGQSQMTWVILQDYATATDLVNYLWVDTPLAGGALRVGKQRLSVPNFIGGVFNDSTFMTATKQKGTGVSYTTKIMGYKTQLQWVGNMFLLDNKGGLENTTNRASLAALVDTGMGANLGIVYSDQGAATPTAGISIYGDYVMSAAGLNLMMQVWFDLSNDAAQADIQTGGPLYHYTLARRLLNVLVTYPMTGFTPYAGVLYSFNSDNDAMLKYQYLLGVKVPMSDEVFANLEFGNTNTSAGDSTSFMAALGWSL